MDNECVLWACCKDRHLIECSLRADVCNYVYRMDGLIYEQEVICPYYANYASQLLDIPSIAFDGSISPASYATCRMCARVVLQIPEESSR